MPMVLLCHYGTLPTLVKPHPPAPSSPLPRRFWQCPNGKECKYRHALPPGYVLKSQMKELLEQEAANVSHGVRVFISHHGLVIH